MERLLEPVLASRPVKIKAAPEKNRVKERLAYLVVAIGLSVIGLILFIGGASNPRLLYAAIGCWALAIMLIPPVVVEEYGVYSTWGMATLSVILGLFLRGLYMSYGIPDSATLDTLFFLGRSPGYFLWPSVLILVGLALMAVGYCVSPKQSRLIKTPRRIDLRSIYIFAFVALLASFASTVLYVQLTGGLDFSDLSSKRTLIEDIEVSREHRTYQSLRLISSFAIIAHLFVLADSLRANSNKRVAKLLLALLLFLFGSFLPFYVSSRGLVMIYFLFSFGVVSYVRRRVPVVSLVMAGIFCIFLFQFMSEMRSVRNVKLLDALVGTSIGAEILEPLVLNRNELEIAKTAHIIKSIPKRLSFQYGKTIAVWFAAPIPRSLWNDKPLIHSGPIIGNKIYRNRISGVPPGFIAEMYWNFHFVGVLVGSFLFGWFLRYIHEKFKPDRGEPVVSSVVYVYGPMQIGYLMIGTSIGFGLITAGIATIIVLVLGRVFTDSR